MAADPFSGDIKRLTANQRGAGELAITGSSTTWILTTASSWFLAFCAELPLLISFLAGHEPFGSTGFGRLRRLHSCFLMSSTPDCAAIL